MYVQVHKKHLTEWVEHSNYMIVLWALLIGFVLARSIVDPHFISKTSPSMDGVVAQADAQAHGSAEPIPSEPAVNGLPDDYFTETTEIAAAQLVPHVFLKLQNTNGTYLLDVGTNNFTVSTDNFKKKLVTGEWHFFLRINGQQQIEFFSSPLYLSPDRLTAGTNVIQVILVDNMSQPLSHQGDFISETLTITY